MRRVFALWWGSESVSAKVKKVRGQDCLAITPKSAAVAYGFFRSRCSHGAVMAGLVPQGARFNHKRIFGWPWDITRIVGYEWNISHFVRFVTMQSLAQEDQHVRTVVTVVIFCEDSLSVTRARGSRCSTIDRSERYERTTTPCSRMKSVTW